MTEDRTESLRKHNETLNEFSKHNLQEAILILMKEKPFDKITITELCKKAGVSRMAFYKNYHDTEELLLDIFIDGNTEMIEEIGSPFRNTTGYEWFYTMFCVIEQYSEMLQLLFDAGFQYKYLTVVNELVLHNPAIENKDKYKRLIWTGAIVNVLIEWVEGGMVEPKEEMAKICLEYTKPM